MNLFDIIVLIIMAAIVLRAWFKGFSGTVLSFASFVVSAVAAWILHPKLAEMLYKDEVPIIVLNGISIVIVYALSMLVCTIVSFLVNSFLKLPVLKSLNKLLGIALGVVCALIFAKIASSGVVMFYEGMSTYAPDRFNRDIIDTSIIIKFFN